MACLYHLLCAVSCDKLISWHQCWNSIWCDKMCTFVPLQFMAALQEKRQRCYLCRMIKTHGLNRLEAGECACCICAYTYLYSHIQAHTGTYINLSNKVLVLKAWSWPQELRNWICELLNVRADLWEFEEGWCGEGQASGHVLYKKFNCSG